MYAEQKEYSTAFVKPITSTNTCTSVLFLLNWPASYSITLTNTMALLSHPSHTVDFSKTTECTKQEPTVKLVLHTLAIL